MVKDIALSLIKILNFNGSREMWDILKFKIVQIS